MIVGICGLGYTGSGAVIDLLSEYEGLQVESNVELSFSYRPDGLEDLAHHLMSPKRFTACDVAISRFKKKMEKDFSGKPSFWGIKSFVPLLNATDDYIDSITQIKWKGFWSYDIDNCGYFKQRMYGATIRLHKYCPKLALSLERILFYRDMYFSINPCDFYEITKQYTSKVLELLGFDINKTIIVNQLFSGDNPLNSFNFFYEPKAIVVDKDPRDLYILCKEIVKYDCAWTPTNNVVQFVEFYKSTRKQLYSIESKDLLVVRFEDLIYNYDQEVSKIESFIGLDRESHVKARTLFNPSKSISNTQLFKRYPCYQEDLNYIEENLKEYLFNFKNFESISPQGKAF